MCVVRQGPLITSRTRLCPGLFHPNFPVFFPNQAYKGLDLPTDVKFVWNYLKNSYSQKAFTESCPADQDIIAFYEKLPYKPTAWGANYKLKSPTFSFDTPACWQPVDCMLAACWKPVCSLLTACWQPVDCVLTAQSRSSFGIEMVPSVSLRAVHL